LSKDECSATLSFSQRTVLLLEADEVSKALHSSACKSGSGGYRSLSRRLSKPLFSCWGERDDLSPLNTM